MKTAIISYNHFQHKNTKGGQMYLNTNDQYISSELLHTGTWESYLYNVFNKCIKKGDCVIDVGANIGSHSLIFSDLVGSKGSVHCFEPLEEIFFQLKLNLILNKKNNCIIYRAGVSDSIDTIQINTLNLEISDNFGAKQLNVTDKYEQNDESNLFSKDRIQLVTIDSLNISPNFIKIDAEYLEDKVLLGSINTIKTHKPIILIEIHQTDFEKLLNIITNILKYKIVGKHGCWDYLIISEEMDPTPFL